MDDTVSKQELARLWDRYVEVSQRYLIVKRATDVAEAECTAARNACETAYAHELQCGLAVQNALQEFHAASDAVFLTEVGITPN
jgi:prophage DNA circulation protein